MTSTHSQPVTQPNVVVNPGHNPSSAAVNAFMCVSLLLSVLPMALTCASTTRLCRCTTTTNWTTANTRQSSVRRLQLTAAATTTEVRRQTTASRTVERSSSVPMSIWVKRVLSSCESPAMVDTTAPCCTPTSTPLYCSNTTLRDDVGAPWSSSSPINDRLT